MVRHPPVAPIQDLPNGRYRIPANCDCLEKVSVHEGGKDVPCKRTGWILIEIFDYTIPRRIPGTTRGGKRVRTYRIEPLDGWGFDEDGQPECPKHHREMMMA